VQVKEATKGENLYLKASLFLSFPFAFLAFGVGQESFYPFVRGLQSTRSLSLVQSIPLELASSTFADLLTLATVHAMGAITLIESWWCLSWKWWYERKKSKAVKRYDFTNFIDVSRVGIGFTLNGFGCGFWSHVFTNDLTKVLFVIAATPVVFVLIDLYGQRRRN